VPGIEEVFKDVEVKPKKKAEGESEVNT